jgi:hypothetical protein
VCVPPTPTESAACSTGIEEELDKPYTDKVWDTGEEGKVVEEKLTVRKEDIVPLKFGQEALIVVPPPVLRSGQNLVDFGGREVDNGIARLNIVPDPGKRVLFLLFDRHEQVWRFDFPRGDLTVSG